MHTLLSHWRRSSSSSSLPLLLLFLLRLLLLLLLLLPLPLLLLLVHCFSCSYSFSPIASPPPPTAPPTPPLTAPAPSPPPTAPSPPPTAPPPPPTAPRPLLLLLLSHRYSSPQPTLPSSSLLSSPFLQGFFFRELFIHTSLLTHRPSRRHSQTHGQKNPHPYRPVLTHTHSRPHPRTRAHTHRHTHSNVGLFFSSVVPDCVALRALPLRKAVKS